MGIFGDPSNRFKDYVDKVKNDNQVRCTFCNKTSDDIRTEYHEYMKNPAEEYEDINIDDMIILSEKLLKPVCASCYFTIKKNPQLIEEIFNRPEEEVW